MHSLLLTFIHGPCCHCDDIDDTIRFLRAVALSGTGMLSPISLLMTNFSRWSITLSTSYELIVKFQNMGLGGCLCIDAEVLTAKAPHEKMSISLDYSNWWILWHILLCRSTTDIALFKIASLPNRRPILGNNKNITKCPNGGNEVSPLSGHYSISPKISTFRLRSYRYTSNNTLVRGAGYIIA